MKILSRGVLILFLVLAIGAGCSQKSGSEEQAAAPKSEQAQPQAMEQAQPMEQQPAAMPAQEAQPAAMADEQVAPAQQAAAQPEEISGTVVRTEDGIALFSDAGHFLVNGQQLDELVGKNVKVTATMAEGAEKPTISVISVYVIENE